MDQEDISDVDISFGSKSKKDLKIKALKLIIRNRDNEQHLNTKAKPKVENEVKTGYIRRQMWEKLKDPKYTDKGGIISLMGRTIINRVRSMAS